MIRLNPAAAAKRRQNATTNNNRKQAAARQQQQQQVDNEDAGTHDDMYDEATNNGNGTGTSSRVNRLFEELLGDNASGIASNMNTTKGGEESTAMSSILGPILRQNTTSKPNDNGKQTQGQGQQQGGNNNNNVQIVPEERKASRDYVMNINSNNNPMLGRMKQNRQQQQQRGNNNKRPQAPPRKQQVDEITTTDEDTYMTKPREINFDPNDDDVSALFGGHGGASMSGVESYMGTFAAQRKNRQKGGQQQQQQQNQQSGGGGNKFGGRNNNNRRQQPQQEEEVSRLTGGTSTFKSSGLSILEEIGLRPQSKSKNVKGSFSEDEEEIEESGKGKNYRSRSSNNQERSGRRRGTRNDKGDNESEYSPPETTCERIKNTKPKTWAVLLVGVMFITIQFTTVQKRDKSTMDYLNWRFQNHRYSTARDSSVYSSSNGLSAGIRNVVMDNVKGAGRRRGAYAGESSKTEEQPNSLNKDGIGDVLRKTVPLVQRKEWEQDQIMFDDGIDGMDANPNLRGGMSDQRVKNNMANEAQVQQQEKQQKQELDALREQVQQQQQKSEQDQQQMQGNKMTGDSNAQPPQGKRMMMAEDKDENVEGVHPLLKPKKGLSMADALTKLNAGSDKLADIAPLRPQQALSNDLLPTRFNVFADLKTPYKVGRDTPFFWHIPRSGGVVVKTLLSHCLGQTLAAEVGELDGHDKDTELKVISFSEHNYTNVNIATPDGITRALDMGLVPSHLSKTLVSAHVDLIPSLFNSNDQARAFVLFRHPVGRAASMFYFLKGTGYPPLKDMTVDDYAKSELIENNWLVRILSESMTGPIDMDNLEIAKEVLKRKFIVGLLDNKRGSFARFDHYFKWKDSPNYDKEFGCRKQLMDEKYTPKHPIRKDSETWKLLLEQNRYDVHLYDYAKELFSHQSYIFGL